MSVFFQKVKCLSLTKQNLPNEKHRVFLGFSSDAGVIRNEGRPGAQSGPDKIRTQLAKLACHKEDHYIDLGNILCTDDKLESAQKQFAEMISLCHQQGHKTIAFGGGHEIAWPHFKGLSHHYSKLGIINFDAHFDLRPLLADNRGSSGTPFTQIAKFCTAINSPFSYCCLGIQEQGNTKSLFKFAKELNVSYLTADDMIELDVEKQKNFLNRFIHNCDHIYLSICLDAFAESFAPGVSAPQALGISPYQAIPLLKHILKSKKVVSFDVAELSPPLDHENKTARLAAFLIAKLLDEF